MTKRESVSTFSIWEFQNTAFELKHYFDSGLQYNETNDFWWCGLKDTVFPQDRNPYLNSLHRMNMAVNPYHNQFT